MSDYKFLDYIKLECDSVQFINVSGLDDRKNFTERMPERELLISILMQALNDISAIQQKTYSEKRLRQAKSSSHYLTARYCIFCDDVTEYGTLKYIAHVLCDNPEQEHFFVETIRRKVKNKTINFLFSQLRRKNK